MKRYDNQPYAQRHIPLGHIRYVKHLASVAEVLPCVVMQI
jgi:hypothetical protein